MRNAKRLLELLALEYPTSSGVRHSITLNETRPLVSIWFPAENSRGSWTSETFYLTEVDLDKSPEQILEEIKAVRLRNAG